MHHFEKKNLKIFSPEGLTKMFGAPQECFPGPRCGSRRAITKTRNLGGIVLDVQGKGRIDVGL